MAYASQVLTSRETIPDDMAGVYLALGWVQWAGDTAWGLPAEDSWRGDTPVAALAVPAGAHRRTGALPGAADSMGTASHTSLLRDTVLVLHNARCWTSLCEQCPGCL